MAPEGRAVATAPTYDVDFYSDEFIRNPWPRYAEMRALGPVIWLPRHGNFALTQHAVVAAAVRDAATFISASGVAADPVANEMTRGNSTASDGERHTAIRGATSAPLLPGALEAVRPRLEQESGVLIEKLVARRDFDAVVDLAIQLPLSVVRDLVGLPDFGRENMLRWANATFDLLGVQNDRGRAAVETFLEQRAFLQEHTRPEVFRPGSWSRRLYDLVEEGSLDASLAPVAMRDYLNPSLDTTISAIGQLLFQLGSNPDEWEKLRQRPELARNAANEAVRMASPVRSFSRHTSRAVTIEGVELPAGARVMMLFASANRDERVFDEPGRFDITRNPRHHLGFGSGIHMCVGQHLAQLEMIALLEAMIPRVREIAVGKPILNLNNTIYGFSSLSTTFVEETDSSFSAAIARKIEHASDERRAQTPSRLQARVLARQELGRGIVGIDIGPVEGQHLPPWEPGAHVDVHISDGLVRQYSLTGRYEADRYRIAVQLEEASAGGSRAVHGWQVGTEVELSHPRNQFILDVSGSRYVLFSAGIGITPILAMAWRLHHLGREFTWHLSARSADHLAWGREIEQWPFADRMLFHFSNEDRRLAAAKIAPMTSAYHVYACGPKEYMDCVQAWSMNAGAEEKNVHVEHFNAEIDVDGDPFEVFAARSGVRVRVEANQTMVAALRKIGIKVETGCQNGVCGTCLTRVVSGRPDHRDMVLTEAEKAEGLRVAVCCSRSRSAQLELDL